MNGRSTSWTTGLGIVEVSGRSRVPSPPARISACTIRPSPAPRSWLGQNLQANPLADSPLCQNLQANPLAESPSPAHALVDEPGPGGGVAVDEVASVDDQVAGHPLAHLGPVQLGELRPLGHQHACVGAVDR